MQREDAIVFKVIVYDQEDHHQTCSSVWKWDLGTEKGWARLSRKNKYEDIEMGDWNNEDWKDKEWRNKSNSGRAAVANIS